MVSLTDVNRKTREWDVSNSTGTLVTTRWSTTLSSKVNLFHTIDFRAVCGVHLVPHPSKFGGNETFGPHRVARRTNSRGESKEVCVCSPDRVVHLVRSSSP